MLLLQHSSLSTRLMQSSENMHEKLTLALSNQAQLLQHQQSTLENQAHIINTSSTVRPQKESACEEMEVVPNPLCKCVGNGSRPLLQHLEPCKHRRRQLSMEWKRTCALTTTLSSHFFTMSCKLSLPFVR